MVLAGASVVYLDSFPLDQYSMYDAVPTRELKRIILELEGTGKLGRVRMLLLTNCTFESIGEGFGTLYTAVYQPMARSLDLHWPGVCWTLSLDGELAGSRRIAYPGPV